MTHEAASDNPCTRGIAEFVSGLRYEAIPPAEQWRDAMLGLESLEDAAQVARLMSKA